MLRICQLDKCKWCSCTIPYPCTSRSRISYHSQSINKYIHMQIIYSALIFIFSITSIFPARGPWTTFCLEQSFRLSTHAARYLRLRLSLAVLCGGGRQILSVNASLSWSTFVSSSYGHHSSWQPQSVRRMIRLFSSACRMIHIYRDEWLVDPYLLSWNDIFIDRVIGLLTDIRDSKWFRFLQSCGMVSSAK